MRFSQICTITRVVAPYTRHWYTTSCKPAPVQLHESTSCCLLWVTIHVESHAVCRGRDSLLPHALLNKRFWNQKPYSTMIKSLKMLRPQTLVQSPCPYHSTVYVSQMWAHIFLDVLSKADAYMHAHILAVIFEERLNRHETCFFSSCTSLES